MGLLGSFALLSLCFSAVVHFSLRNEVVSAFLSGWIRFVPVHWQHSSNLFESCWVCVVRRKSELRAFDRLMFEPLDQSDSMFSSKEKKTKLLSPP
jgi:hypothetical protein